MKLIQVINPLTLTLLERLEDTINPVKNIGHTVEKAKEINTELKIDIVNGNNTKSNLEIVITNEANTVAVSNKNNLDVVNVEAGKNYNALNQIRDARNLAKIVLENTMQFSGRL